MTVPLYLLERIVRHGSAVQRLIDERKREEGEQSGRNDGDAIAFDAADFVVTFLALSGDESVLETRKLRDHLAQLISTAIREHELHQQPEEKVAVFKNEESSRAPGQYDGMRYVLEEEDGEYARKSQIEAYIRNTGYEKFLSLHLPESLRRAFADSLQKGEFSPRWFNSSLNLELSVQPEWLTDGRQRVAARRRSENLHIRVPLDSIRVSYVEEQLSDAEPG